MTSLQIFDSLARECQQTGENNLNRCHMETAENSVQCIYLIADLGIMRITGELHCWTRDGDSDDVGDVDSSVSPHSHLSGVTIRESQPRHRDNVDNT